MIRLMGQVPHGTYWGAMGPEYGLVGVAPIVQQRRMTAVAEQPPPGRHCGRRGQIHGLLTHRSLADADCNHTAVPSTNKLANR